MKVLKFGGTSVGSPESIKSVKDIVKNELSAGTQFAVVVSAFGGVTNNLIEAGHLSANGNDGYRPLLHKIEQRHFNIIKALFPPKNQSRLLAKVKILLNELEELLYGLYLLREFTPRISDMVVSFGERISASVLAEYLNQEGCPSQFTDARNLIKTDSNYSKARVNYTLTNELITKHFASNDQLQIITGFLASDEAGTTTTLGRGGSDYTAAIFAAALNAEEIQIWTDVDGMMTADPRVVKKAFSLKKLSYIEAMELSHFGAKVIYPPTLQPAFSKNIPIRVKNTFNPSFEGTLITNQADDSLHTVKGISSIPKIAMLNLQGSGLVGVAGISARLFTTLAQHNVNVILITQSSSEHSISFAVSPEQAQIAKRVVDETFSEDISRKRIEPLIVEDDKSVIALIGERMKHRAGISADVFDALGEQGINVTAIAQGSSELNISLVIDQRNLSKAVNTLHERFFLSDKKTMRLYLSGPGLIGSTLLNQIMAQQNYLSEKHNLDFKVLGITNSRKMLFDEEGINLDKWKTLLEDSDTQADIATFIDKAILLNQPNTVFVDCSASEATTQQYLTALNASIPVVTPNKLANSGSYKHFTQLKQAAKRFNTKFLYETNVGAGLPIIGTLKGLITSGDQIIKIEAILSGTISYLFNSFGPGKSFATLVKEACEMGFTEPDPRDDLNGMDMARKMLILAREAGYALEMEDIEIDNILPGATATAPDVDTFFEALEAENQFFESRRQQAEKENKKLRYIGRFENGKASISFVAIDAEHPFYTLSGSDNIIAFTTDRYKELPLVVKGPGAGAEVTAAGVFADVISLANTHF